MLHEEELLYLTRQGCPYAQSALIDWIQIYVKKVITASAYNKVYETDFFDVSQNAILACISAIDRYRTDQNCLFRTYISTIIRNQTYTALKKVYQQKERYYDHCVYLDAPSIYGFSNEELIEDDRLTYNPKKQLVVKEASSKYNIIIDTKCSPLEKEVIFYRMEGYRQQEIANMLNVDIKVIYNAIYRLQKKLNQVNCI